MKLSNIVSLLVLVPMFFGGLLWFDLRSIPLVSGIGYDISSELKKISVDYNSPSGSIGGINSAEEQVESEAEEELSEDQEVAEERETELQKDQDKPTSLQIKQVESADTTEEKKNDFNGKNPYNI